MGQVQLYGWRVLSKAQYVIPSNYEVKIWPSWEWKVAVWEDNLKVNKGDQFHTKVMINLKIGKDQYNAFIVNEEMKVMCKIDDLDPITRLKK